jgi:hypothetical protein
MVEVVRGGVAGPHAYVGVDVVLHEGGVQPSDRLQLLEGSSSCS